jgi:hypothetical protein
MNTPTCGAACPDIWGVTCTHPAGHPPIPRVLQGIGVRAMDHGNETLRMWWQAAGITLVHSATGDAK